MNQHPRDMVATAPMSRLQWLVVIIMITLNALDGFDVLAISFAAPGIAREWGIDRAQLGIVLSMELLGMAAGSITLGGLADRIGRRGTMLGCLVLMTVGMMMVTTATNLTQLSLWRVLTGLGIGGMLAVINAMVAEFANARHRSLCVSLMAAGYPLGAVLGGLVTAQLLKTHDWRVIFEFGAAVTALCLVMVLWKVPESIDWLAHKQPAAALEKINRTLARIGHATLSALPAVNTAARQASFKDAFAPGVIATTLLVTAAYFFHITTFYYLQKWIPKIVVDQGFAASAAAGVLVWTNLGGVVGGALLGLLTQRFAVKQLTVIMMLGSVITVNLFGQGSSSIQQLSIICACAGFCITAAIVGLYALFAQAFPTHIRAFGTGFAIGVGRGGAVLAPIIAGYMFKAGQPLATVSFIMALGSLVAAGLLTALSGKSAAASG